MTCTILRRRAVSGRPNALRNRSDWRSAPQRASAASPSTPARARGCVALWRSARAHDGAVAAAVEVLGEPQQRRQAHQEQLVAGLAQRRELAELGRPLAVVAHGLRDQRELALAEPGQAGGEDQVARVLVMVVVVDRHADVVQHPGRPQQLARRRGRGLAGRRRRASPAAGRRALRRGVQCTEIGLVLGREVAHARDADVVEQRRLRRLEVA